MCVVSLKWLVLGIKTLADINDVISIRINNVVVLSVNELTPADIKVVGALGDSITVSF